MEKKNFKTVEVSLELKADDKERGKIKGYAAVFGNIDRHGDILQPNSLKNKGAKVPLLWNHNPDEVIGSVKLTEDEKGYFYDGVIAVNSKNEDIRKKAEWVYSLIEEGHVNRNSFGFIIEEGKWETRKINGKQEHVFLITKTDVAEVSIVPMPANPKAGVTDLKSYTGELEKRIASLQKQLEELKTGRQQIHESKAAKPVQDISDAVMWGLF
jgi:uncharacterized protein